MRAMLFGLAVLLPAFGVQASGQPCEVMRVGPAPQMDPHASTSDGKGSLRVYTPTQLLSNGGVSFRKESGYRIYSEDGKLLRKVANSIPYQIPGPVDVTLAPGAYTIEGEGDFYPMVRVPVEIIAGKTTEVHLAGTWLRPSHTPNSRLVKLPNGEAVGWRAATESASAAR